MGQSGAKDLAVGSCKLIYLNLDAAAAVHDFSSVPLLTTGVYAAAKADPAYAQLQKDVLAYEDNDDHDAADRSQLQAVNADCQSIAGPHPFPAG